MSRDAAQLVRAIIANHDEQPHTAHHLAAQTADRDELPERVRRLLERRAQAVRRRCALYRQRGEAVTEWQIERQRAIEHHHSRDREYDGLEL